MLVTGPEICPQSAVNMERAKGVLKLKSDVSMLAEMDKGLKNELQDQREDMARLVKDVARVQLMAQNLKDKLTLVLTASRQFQQDIATLKEGQVLSSFLLPCHGERRLCSLKSCSWNLCQCQETVHEWC